MHNEVLSTNFKNIGKKYINAGNYQKGGYRNSKSSKNTKKEFHLGLLNFNKKCWHCRKATQKIKDWGLKTMLVRTCDMNKTNASLMQVEDSIEGSRERKKKKNLVSKQNFSSKVEFGAQEKPDIER